MQNDQLLGVLEAVLFISGEAVSTKNLALALEIPEESVLSALEQLERELEQSHRGFYLKRFGTNVQLSTKGEFAPVIERMLQPLQRQTLSQAAMETLSIVAYRQPVTRQEVEEVRGVQCDYSLQSLLQKGLIRDAGRKETLGRPILYVTTDRFLSHFDLRSLAELPPLPQSLQDGRGEQLDFDSLVAGEGESSDIMDSDPTAPESNEENISSKTDESSNTTII